MAYTSGGTNGEAHEKVDVFICGSGSAGLSAATWLARYGVRCKIVDSRSGPLDWGTADGIQTRTTEIFESFGIEDELLREGFHNLEVAFTVQSARKAPLRGQGALKHRTKACHICLVLF